MDAGDFRRCDRSSKTSFLLATISMFALRARLPSLTAVSRQPTLVFLSTTQTRTVLGDHAQPLPPEPTMLDFSNSALGKQPPHTNSQVLSGDVPVGRGFPKAFRPTPFPDPSTIRSPLRYRLHCRSSRNNTMVQVTEPDGRSVGWFSGGSLKFKGANRSSYEAGYQCAVAAFRVIEGIVKEKGQIQVELYLRGFGNGREAMKIALLATEGENVRKLVSLIQDRTPIKIGGTRAPKARRL